MVYDFCRRGDFISRVWEVYPDGEVIQGRLAGFCVSNTTPGSDGRRTCNLVIWNEQRSHHWADRGANSSTSDWEPACVGFKNFLRRDTLDAQIDHQRILQTINLEYLARHLRAHFSVYQMVLNRDIYRRGDCRYLGMSTISSLLAGGTRSRAEMSTRLLPAVDDGNSKRSDRSPPGVISDSDHYTIKDGSEEEDPVGSTFFGVTFASGDDVISNPEYHRSTRKPTISVASRLGRNSVCDRRGQCVDSRVIHSG